MTDNYDPHWHKHLDDLEEHYRPDKFFIGQETKPTNEPNIQEHFFAPAFTEETNFPEEAQLSVDIFQDENNIYVVTPIAAARLDTLEVSLDKDILTIRGERNHEYVSEQRNYLYQECYWGKFSRSIILPLPVRTDAVEADFKDGVLKVKLPKAMEMKKIEIRVKQN